MNEKFYFKNSRGKYLPVDFKSINMDDWDNKMIVVRVGSDDVPATKEDAEQVATEMQDLDALSTVHASYLILDFGIDFEVFDDIEKLKNKNVCVFIRSGDDLAQLGESAREAKRALSDHAKKAVVLPTPLTVDQYAEINEVRKRMGIVKKRRGS